MNTFQQSGMIAHPDWRQRAVESWARLTWRKRMTQWLRGDERRDFVEIRPGNYVACARSGKPMFRRNMLGGTMYQLPRVIFAETLSQWNLTPTSVLSKATPQ